MNGTMNQSDRPLLSICIPTYNRAGSLLYCLGSVIEATSKFQECVEIVVSNNCSTDGTKDILESFKSVPNFRHFTNQSNIGFNFNYFKLIDEYSKGKYCWIIGDDDFLKSDSVSKVLAILSLYPEIEFIFANYETKPITEIIKYFNGNFQFSPIIDHHKEVNNGLCIFNELLNKDPKTTNILLTFISVSIFKREPLRNFDKSIFNSESLVTFKDLFPHAFMFATIMKHRKAYYFNEPLVIAAIQKKDWDKSLPILFLKYIPELAQYYRSLGYSKAELFKTDEIIAYSGFKHFLKGLSFNWDSINPRLLFIKYFFLNPALLSMLFKHSFTLCIKYFKNYLR
jgi:glycosyltransferase involved in cell wall biosynthesis